MTTLFGKCTQCKKEFTAINRKKSNNTFCSIDCFKLFRKNQIKDSNCECGWCNKKFYKKPSAIKNGEGKFCSLECKHSSQRDGIIINGESYNDRHLLRQSSKYKCWRLAAKKIKNYCCEECGIKEGEMCGCCDHKIVLQVHHIKPFAVFKGLRFDPNNASVLCEKCHNKKTREK